MGELARRARLSKQTMTTLVRLAERDGLVVRERDPRDARAFRVSLAPRARAFEPVAGRVLDELDALVAAQLPPSRSEVLRAALREVADL